MVVDNKLKAEDELLLRCARSKLEKEDEARISFLLDKNLDWDYLLNKATRNRLRPLLYLNLNQVGPERVPEDVLQGLKSFFKNNARRNLMLTGELVKVMALLEDNGIKAVTYKGPVLAQGAYGNLAYREFRDIDIFIKKSTVSKAKKVLLENDYCLDPPIEVDDSLYMKLDTEYRFKSSSGVLIELNWGFEGHFFYFPHDSQIILKDSIKQNINNLDIRTPSPENEFLMLCIHCAKHNWQRLSWICDLGEVLNRKEINWNEFWEKTEKLGVKKIVYISLILLNDCLGYNIPHKEIKENKDAQKIAHKIIKRKFQNDQDSWNLVEKFFLDLKKRDKIIYGLKDCINGLRKPSYDDYIYFKMPESIFSLYLLLRPLLLLRKYGKKEI